MLKENEMLKKCLKIVMLFFVLSVLLIGAFSKANAAGLHIEWSYEFKNPDNFKLYNQEKLEIASFPGSVRVGDFDYIQTEDCAPYYLTAIVNSKESPISNIFTFCKPDTPIVGQFLITVKQVQE